MEVEKYSFSIFVFSIFFSFLYLSFCSLNVFISYLLKILIKIVDIYIKKEVKCRDVNLLTVLLTLDYVHENDFSFRPTGTKLKFSPFLIFCG